MPTITVKNIPADLYEQLKHAAEMNRRSINSEIIVCIERALKSRNSEIADILQQARKLRERTAHYQNHSEELRQAKQEGRP